MRPVAARRHADLSKPESSPSAFATERVMACMDSAAPASEVLYAAARLSSELHAVWYAVYVSIPGAGEPRHPGTVPGPLSDNVALAEQLGAVVVRITADDHVDGLLAFAHREGVTHVVVGDRTPPASVRTRSIAARLKSGIHGATLVAVPLGADHRRSAHVLHSGGSHV
jgi:K+-sensing histidine kinase KdpD